MAGHPAIARQDIAHRIVADMAHMDAPRRIGEHLEHIAFGLGGLGIGSKSPGVFPGFLPMRVHRLRIEA